MGLVVATTFGLIVWVVLWSIGAKGFDAFLLTALIILVGATLRVASRHLPGHNA